MDFSQIKFLNNSSILEREEIIFLNRRAVLVKAKIEEENFFYSLMVFKEEGLDKEKILNSLLNSSFANEDTELTFKTEGEHFYIYFNFYYENQ